MRTTIETLWQIQKFKIACLTMFVAFLGDASACSQILTDDNASLGELEKAEYVFRGLAVKVELSDEAFLDNSIMFTKVYYRSVEVLKGDVPEDGYILSCNGYFGGCAVPVLVGVEYLFAPNKEEVIQDFEAPKELRSLLNNSIGMISIFNTTALPGYKPRLDEAMAEVREWAAKQR
ncbi:MAG: hypothetical protein JJ858_06425 [Rhizobiaceae bacterium]|nr:hypothetical protein [Rhizobiaceae bacterium]